jgi:hypothetical protein
MESKNMNDEINKRYIELLLKITKRNEISGVLISLLFIFNILVLVFSLFLIRNIIYGSFEILLLSSAITVIEIMMIIIFQSNCKKGNVLFDEISDDIESIKNYKSINDNNSTNEYKYIRYINKRYLASTELPLIQGKYGATIYFLLSLVIYIIVLFFIFTLKKLY